LDTPVSPIPPCPPEWLPRSPESLAWEPMCIEGSSHGAQNGESPDPAHPNLVTASPVTPAFLNAAHAVSRDSTLSLQLVIFNLIALAITGPLLFQMADSLGQKLDTISTEVQSVLVDQSQSTTQIIRAWYTNAETAVEELAQTAAEDGDPTHLDRETRQVLQLSPALTHLHIYNRNLELITQRSLPHSPWYGELSHLSQPPTAGTISTSTFSPTLSTEVLTRIWNQLQTNPVTLLTPVSQNEEGDEGVIYTAAPIQRSGQLQGFTLGIIELQYLNQVLADQVQRYPLTFYILDQDGQPIASSDPKIRLGMDIFAEWNQGQQTPLGQQGVYEWRSSQGKSTMTRWRNSFYVIESPLNLGRDWQLHVRLSPVSYIDSLEQFQVSTLSLMLFLLGLTLPLVALISQRLVQPLLELAKITTDVPRKVWDQTKIPWSSSPIQEIALLSHNFQGMARVLQHQFQEVQAAKQNLEERVRFRTQELEQSQEQLAQLAAIVQFSDDAIWSQDLQGLIRSWNRGAEKIFGYTAAEMIGQPITRLCPPEQAQELRQTMERVEQGQSIDHYESIRLHKNGRC
ncbi:MAG: PAS domain S-box protein, partial [Prochlorothrix sp.]